MMLAALLLCVLQDEDIDPSKYLWPSQAKSVDVKGAAAAAPASRAYLGISGGETSEEGGVVLADVPEDGPAGKAGLRAGDRVLAFAGEEVKDYNRLVAIIGAKRPGEKVSVRVEREDEEKEFEVTLGSRAAGGGEWGVSFWRKPEFRLAVVPFEFSDEKHNPDFVAAAFERMLFSRGAYAAKSPSGDAVYGSLADYYAENSHGKLAVAGKCFDWVALERPRAYFEERRMGDREASRELLPKALELVRARDGESCFDEFDGLVFIYAGKQTYKRPWMLWPHRASIKAGKRSLPYYLNAEGGKYFNAIGVHVHEFGHMLGLPDQYGRNHATGIGKWCTMAVGHMGGGESRNGRPFHLCVWCKEKLGWVKVTSIAPEEEQAIRLAAIEADPTQAVRILLKPDGSQCYWLENRQRIGSDRDLEGTGMLVWYQGGGRGPFASIDLVEAHGRKVPNASLVETDEIPFPSLYNRHFTPDTTPASTGAVHLTDIVEKDGVVYFRIGTKAKAATRTLEKKSDY